MNYQAYSLHALSLPATLKGRPHFFNITYDQYKELGEPSGISFSDYVIENGKFRSSGRILQSTFIQPGNVYFFTAPTDR